MNELLTDGRLFSVLRGDARAVLATFPDESVDCCVTSPPYFGLRDYGDPGQIGRETSVLEYVAALAGVFEQVRRILKPQGTLWLNLGDSYANDLKWGGRTSGKHPIGLHHDRAGIAREKRSSGLPGKSLCGIPWRVAFALQYAGWILRSDIVWHKPAPLPESVTDRPTKSHEYVFLLAKSTRYYYDHKAIAEPCTESSHRRYSQNVRDQQGSARANGGEKTNGTLKAAHDTSPGMEGMRNRRSVWTVNAAKSSGAHFAVMPSELVTPMIRAGCPAGGIVLDPFSGTGTTGYVALREGRRYVGIEINECYAAQSDRRIAGANLPLDGA